MATSFLTILTGRSEAIRRLVELGAER